MQDDTAQQERITVRAAEAADMLGVSVRHFSDLVAEGQAPQPVRLGRCARWPIQSLRTWVDDGCPPEREPRESREAAAMDASEP